MLFQIGQLTVILDSGIKIVEVDVTEFYSGINVLTHVDTLPDMLPDFISLENIHIRVFMSRHLYVLV